MSYELRSKNMTRLTCLLTIALAFICMPVSADITEQGGWLEAAYVKWTAVSGATDYNVYVKPENGEYAKIDGKLLRQYADGYRADALGLKAGSYIMKVVPVINGTEDNASSMQTGSITVAAHDRSGFAHYNRSEGVGAYNNDGTLKAGARILYVTADNASTVSLDMQVDSKGKIEMRTGLQDIIQAYEKGYEARPLAIRIIGCIRDGNMDSFLSSEEGLQVKGKSGSIPLNLTIEGVGDDATIYGFGILCRAVSSVEFRNFAIMLCMDDCLSIDTDNYNVWVHNMDFFYGNAGKDADQAKGDGTVDIKGKSSHITVSYNHFFDSGKCSLGGMKSETTDCWMTYHHNWFDHSDSRHPRIRTAFYHVYNNYFDGNAKYGVGVTYGGSAFVENNYFRNCKYPMLISKQGTDAQGDGTFSGEPGGVIKAYGNHVMGAASLKYYTEGQTDGKWDAVNVGSRNANVSATAYSGGTPYNDSADAEAVKAVPAGAVIPAEDIPATVCGALGAGRIGHGDFQWKFDNATEDGNSAVITELKTALTKYKSSLIGFADGTAIGSTDPGTGGGDDPGTGGEVAPLDKTVIVSFTYEDKMLGISDSKMVRFKGNAKTGASVTFEGKTYDVGLKMESEGKTEVVITPPSTCRIILVFDAAGKKLKLDGTTYTTDDNNTYAFNAEGGRSYTLLKGETMNLYAIKFIPTMGNGIADITAAQKSMKIYDIQGRKITTPAKGQVYMMGGKKYTQR